MVDIHCTLDTTENSHVRYVAKCLKSPTRFVLLNLGSDAVVFPLFMMYQVSVMRKVAVCGQSDSKLLSSLADEL